MDGCSDVGILRLLFLELAYYINGSLFTFNASWNSFMADAIVNTPEFKLAGAEC